MRMPDAVAEAINEQIRMEFQASHLYLAMSAWFDRQNLPGFAHWMRLQASEEREHAERFFDHMSERGATIELRAIDAPPRDFGAVRDAVERVGHHEGLVTASIHAIHDLAGATKDYATQHMLQWFIAEQVEEEKQAADLLARLDLVEQGRGSLLMVDRELAQRT